MDKALAAEERKRICQLLAAEARAKGIDPDVLATASGLRTNTVASILAGRFAATLDQLIALADAMGLTIEFKNK